MAAVTTPSFDEAYGVLEAEICNRGLIRISVEPISDTETDLSIQARTCKSVYAVSRNELLRYIAPSFAVKTALIPIDEAFSDPMDGYSAAYDISGLSMLRLVGVNAKDDAEYALVGSGTDHRLLTSEPSEYNSDGVLCVQIRYIKEIKDPSLFDDLFKEALCLSVAYKCAVGITQNPTMLQLLKSEAAQASHVAKMASTSERQSDPYDEKWTDRG